jgi:hypothetical protein
MSIVIGVGFLALGTLLSIAGVRRLITALSIHRNTAVPIRDVTVHDAPLEFQGRTEPHPDTGTFTAPFSGGEALCSQLCMGTLGRHRTDADGLEVGNQREPETYRNTEAVHRLAETDEIRRSFVIGDGGARVVVDPNEADLDITGHMGERVLTVDSGESLPTNVCDRLVSLDGLDVEFDTDPETWDRESDRVTYREARLEPGTPVHIDGATVESVSDEWGSAIDASVSASDTDGRFLISEGTESDVVRKRVVRFITGIVFGFGLLAVGLHVLDIVTVL